MRSDGGSWFARRGIPLVASYDSRMSLATRCPACGTIFRVVQDQLKVSEGWVRCGQCHEVFHGIEALFDLDSDPAIAARRAAGRGPVAPPPTRVFADARASAPIPIPMAPPPPAPIAIPTRTPPPVPFQNAVHATPSAFGASELPASTGNAPPAQPGFTPASRPPPPSPLATPANPVPPVAMRGTIAPRFAARLAEESARAQVVPSPGPAAPSFADKPHAPPPFGSMLVPHASPPAPEPAPLPPPESLFREPISFAPMPAPPPAPTYAAPPAPSFSPTPVNVLVPPALPPIPVQPALPPAPTAPAAPAAPAAMAAPAAPAAMASAAELASAFAAPPQSAPATPAAAPAPAVGTTVVREIAPGSAPVEAPPSPSLPVAEVSAPLDRPAAHTADDELRGGPPTLASMLPEDAGEWPPKAGARKKRQREAAATAGEVALVDPRKDPRFLREARSGARWRKPWVRAALGASLALLVLTAIGQYAWPQRDLFASRWPTTLPAWNWLCEQAGCKIEAPRAIASLALDGSSLTRTDTDHVLLFSADLHNRADHAVRMPSFDLTFMDLNGEVVARKVLSPAQIGIRQAALPAEGELHVHARLQVGVLEASGFQADLFYP